MIIYLFPNEKYKKISILRTFKFISHKNLAKLLQLINFHQRYK